MSKVEKTTLFLSGLNVERFINKVLDPTWDWDVGVESWG